MEALLLAGGKAERLGEAAQGLPKPPVPVAGFPLAEYTAARPLAAGVARVVVACRARQRDSLGAAPAGARGALEVSASDPRATGRRRGDCPREVAAHRTAGRPARAAMAAVLLRLRDTLEANVAGTVRDFAGEFLHDLRVSVRRTRSAIKLCGDALPAGLAEKFRDEFKWLGDVTTPVRDLDVYLLNYPAMAAGLESATPPELAPFAEHLARRRTLERRQLTRALRSARFAVLTDAWRGALSERAPARKGRTAARLAAERIRRAHRRVLRDGAAITADSPPESLHDLRKRCKELRYLLEFFASLHDPAIHRQAVRDLKGLQDCLGTYQDCQVQQHEIRMFATRRGREQRSPAPPLRAGGELGGRMARRERRARGELGGRFADFASAANQQRFRALTTDAGR